ncbi:C4-dicarboxylate TRAP transporter substrate-binding protein [Martelella sp. AMO21009]
MSWRVLFGLGVLGLTFTGVGAESVAAQTVLRFADYGPNRGTRAETVEWLFSEIEARTEGRVMIDQHWGGALLGASNGFDGLQSGVADIVTITAVYAPKDLFAYRVGDLPITGENEVAQTMALYDLATTNEAMKAQFDKAGVVYLANYTVGPIQMVCNGADVQSFDDLVGKKVRYTAEYGKIFADMGVTTISLPTPEIYQALSTGLVDCAQTYAYTTLSYKLIEVADQFLVFDLGTLGSNGIFMNKRSFERLSPEDQEIVLQAGKEMTERNATAIRAANQEAIAAFPDGIDGRTLTVVEISDEDRARIEAASAPYVQAWVDESADFGFDGKAVVEEYETLIKSHM